MGILVKAVIQGLFFCGVVLAQTFNAEGLETSKIRA